MFWQFCDCFDRKIDQLSQFKGHDDQPFVNLVDTAEENISAIQYENIGKDLGLNLEEMSEEQNNKVNWKVQEEPQTEAANYTWGREKLTCA